MGRLDRQVAPDERWSRVASLLGDVRKLARKQAAAGG